MIIEELEESELDTSHFSQESLNNNEPFSPIGGGKASTYCKIRSEKVCIAQYQLNLYFLNAWMMQPTASGVYLQADAIQVRCFRIWEENANLYLV